jgi:prephenate dehydrogenase
VDPVLWTELFLANRDALDEVLSRLIGRLLSYRDAINSADAMSLMRLLEEGRKAKEASK